MAASDSDAYTLPRAVEEKDHTANDTDRITVEGATVTTTDDKLDIGPAPDGGLEAWLVAAGGACIFFSCLGFSNAFGTFQQYYRTHQLHDRSTDDVAWIGSLSMFIQFGAGAIGGPMFDRYGAWVIRPFSIIYVFAVMMLSLCTKYWQFMLTQGVLMGVCMAFMQLPAMAAASQYFDKKRAAALGVVVAGSSIGGVVFPITLAKLLNETSVGFGWSVRITGFMMVPFMLFACFAVKSRLPPRKTSFFMVSVLRNRLFVVLVAAMFCAFLGMFTPIFYIPTYAVMHGMTPALASYMLAVINAASTFGRVLPGILADRWGRINMFAFAGLSTGLLVFCMNQATSTAGIVVYSVFFGFTSGMVISGASAAMSACNTNVQHMGTYMGMGMALGSIAVLIGPPVNGTLVTAHHGFVEVSIMSGTFCIVGGVIALGAKTLTPQGILGNV